MKALKEKTEKTESLPNEKRRFSLFSFLSWVFSILSAAFFAFQSYVQYRADPSLLSRWMVALTVVYVVALILSAFATRKSDAVAKSDKKIAVLLFKNFRKFLSSLMPLLLSAGTVFAALREGSTLSAFAARLGIAFGIAIFAVQFVLLLIKLRRLVRKREKAVRKLES